MPTYIPDTPDKEEVVLRIMDEHVTLSNWTQYSFNSHFLTPTDAFSFEVADNEMPERTKSALRLGANVRLQINNVILSDGYIDRISIKADRSAGTVYNIDGRDRLGLAVDSDCDPTLKFKESQTLADALKTLFSQFGWVNDDQFVISNDANRSLSNGAVAKKSHSQKKFGQPLNNYTLHQCKPYPHEGTFAFAARLAQRRGLWIWASVDGEQLIVSTPDFVQEPLFQIRRSTSGDTNILGGAAHFSMADQPTVIIADGFSGQAEFGKGRLKSYCVNPFFGVDADGQVLPEVSKLLAKFPSASQVVMTTQPSPRRAVKLPLRPLYLHDDEAQSQEELDAFVRREMSLLMRKSLTVNYVCEGHGQIVDGQFRAWAPDTVVDVRDEVAGINERMWVLSRTFTKSRTGGTHTELELIRLNSIQFSALNK